MYTTTDWTIERDGEEFDVEVTAYVDLVAKLVEDVTCAVDLTDSEIDSISEYLYESAYETARDGDYRYDAAREE